MTKLGLLIILMLIIMSASAPAAENNFSKPGATDKCPVCGMFVAKYPDFSAQVVFRDKAHAFFDGPKDLFKYYLNIAGYDSQKKSADIVSVLVTDYYQRTSIDARTAVFVVGSDIYGPMGRELIPFRQEAEAKEFMNDHEGKALVRFKDVTSAMLREMD